MRTPVRELYEEAVYKAWKAYDDEVKQIYQSYTDAFELGRVEKDDKTFQWKNVSLVKAWEKRDQNLKTLWNKYQATNDGGLELLRGAISSLRSCIADVFFLKIVFNDRRLLLAAS
jgi:hypothetical protein